MRILVQSVIGLFFFANEQGKVVTVNGDRYRVMLNEILFTKIEEEDIGNIWFQQDGARATQPKLHSMFGALFLKIALSAAELMSFGHIYIYINIYLFIFFLFIYLLNTLQLQIIF